MARDLRGAAFEQAEIARRFDIDRGGAARDPGLQLPEVDSAGLLVMTEGDHIDMAAHLDGLAVIADDREPLGIDQPRQQHLMPAGEARGHADGMAGGAAPAVDRELDHIHLQQLAQLAGIFEPGLVAAMVGLRRAPDRGQEFGAPDDLVDHRRHVMLPAAGAEEVEVLLAGLVARERGDQMALQLRLGFQLARQLERRFQAMGDGDLLEQLLDAGRADLLQHGLLDVGQGIGHPGMGRRFVRFQSLDLPAAAKRIRSAHHVCAVHSCIGAQVISIGEVLKQEAIRTLHCRHGRRRRLRHVPRSQPDSVAGQAAER